MANPHIITLEHRGISARVSCTCGWHLKCRNERRASRRIREHKYAFIIGHRDVLFARNAQTHYDFGFVEDDAALTEITMRDGTHALVPRGIVDRSPAEWKWSR